MINNQAEYDQVFGAKSRVPRSPNHQEKLAQPTNPSSSVGFAIKNENSSSVATKSKPSQSVSPPPEVIRISLIDFEWKIFRKG